MTDRSIDNRDALPRDFVRRPLLSTLAVTLLTALPAAAETYILPDDRTVATLETFQECDVCPEMIVLPLGSFTMGAPLEQSAEFHTPLSGKPPEGEPPDLAQEGPEHPVVVDIPIAIGRNEVTYGEWLSCMADSGCRHDPDPIILTPTGDHILSKDEPVIDVSYFDALEYAAWLNRKVGADVYRLPTEAEWEYAARAGTNTRFAQGESLSSEQANFSDYTQDDTSAPSPHAPVPVDQRDAANAWGVRHMSGNVSERTMSCWSERHLGLSSTSAYLAAVDPSGTCMRVAKGGDFRAGSFFARPAKRGRGDETWRMPIAGFRLVRVLPST